MNKEDILALVHKHAEAEESHLVIATVISYVEGVGSVRIEVWDKGNPGPYRYTAHVYDRETGELLATGNGGQDVETALWSVHWQDVKAHR